jgi:DNA-binding MarR family transcriptional regulator
LATRAGVTRQAAGQLLAEIERCGYVERRPASDDARAIVVHFTTRGRRLLVNVFALVEEIESSFAAVVGREEYDRMRTTLGRLAQAIDPEGSLGQSDESPEAKRSKRR